MRDDPDLDNTLKYKTLKLWPLPVPTGPPVETPTTTVPPRSSRRATASPSPAAAPGAAAGEVFVARAMVLNGTKMACYDQIKQTVVGMGFDPKGLHTQAENFGSQWPEAFDIFIPPNDVATPLELL